MTNDKWQMTDDTSGGARACRGRLGGGVLPNGREGFRNDICFRRSLDPTRPIRPPSRGPASSKLDSGIEATPRRCSSDLPICHLGFVICHAFRLRFAHDMVCEFPSLLPRGVTVAQVTLDHFVMVRIHARQPFDAPEACSWQAIRNDRVRPFFPRARRMGASHALSKPKARRMGCSPPGHFALNGLKKRGPLKRDDLAYLLTVGPPPPIGGRAFVYILACSDGALYIGSAGDLEARLKQHGGPNGAKFTRDDPEGRLVYFEGPFPIAIAFRRERQLKRWSRAKKLALIQNQTAVLMRLSQSREHHPH